MLCLQGVIRIQCVAGRELKKADIGMFGKGKSDPYIKLYGECVYTDIYWFERVIYDVKLCGE